MSHDDKTQNVYRELDKADQRWKDEYLYLYEDFNDYIKFMEDVCKNNGFDFISLGASRNNLQLQYYDKSQNQRIELRCRKNDIAIRSYDEPYNPQKHKGVHVVESPVEQVDSPKP